MTSPQRRESAQFDVTAEQLDGTLTHFSQIEWVVTFVSVAADELRRIFEYYSAAEDIHSLQLTYVRRINFSLSPSSMCTNCLLLHTCARSTHRFHQFVRDCRLLDSKRLKPGDIDVVYRVVTRGGASAAETDLRLNYDRFIDALFQLAAKCYPECTTPADSFYKVRVPVWMLK